MGFLDSSVIDAKTAREGPTRVATAQRSLPTVLSTPTTNVLGSVNKVVTGVTNTVGGAVQTVNNIQNTAVRAVAAANSTARFVSAAVQSVSGLFGSKQIDLASGISGRLQDAFKDTNVKATSNVTKQVSDPVKTNLLKAKLPISTAFKIDSFTAGSQTVSVSGSSAKFGSGAPLMTGVMQSTVLNRYNLDSAQNLGNSITNSSLNKKVNGLFSFASKAATTARNVAVTVNKVSNQVTRVVSAVSREYNAIANTVDAVKGVVGSLGSISSLEDFNDFLGETNNLSNSLLNFDASSYYLMNTAYSLLDEGGGGVLTRRSGVSANTANSIVGLMGRAGCATPNEFYSSANKRASMFNLSLSLASRYGMVTEVSSLLACSQARTTLGQTALTSAFTESVGKQIDTSSLILKSITSPQSLNTPKIRQSIFGNTELSFSDVGVVDSIFETLGTTTKNALTIESFSSDKYPVYDLSLLSQPKSSFIDGVFGDTTLSDYMNSTELRTSKSGTLIYI